MKNGLSLCPYSNQGIATELAWRSITFLRSSCLHFSELSRRFHSAHIACTVLSRPLHCADSVLNTQWHLKEHHTISVQTPRTTTAFAQQPLCALCPPAELLFHCRRLYCAAMLWGPYGDPIALLLERQAMAFALSMLKVRAFAWPSMRSHSF